MRVSNALHNFVSCGNFHIREYHCDLTRASCTLYPSWLGTRWGFLWCLLHRSSFPPAPTLSALPGSRSSPTPCQTFCQKKRHSKWLNAAKSQVTKWCHQVNDTISSILNSQQNIKYKDGVKSVWVRSNVMSTVQIAHLIEAWCRLVLFNPTCINAEVNLNTGDGPTFFIIKNEIVTHFGWMPSNISCNAMAPYFTQ